MERENLPSIGECRKALTREHIVYSSSLGLLNFNIDAQKSV